MQIMGAISVYYPFRQKIELDKPKPGSVTYKFVKPRKSQFSNIEQVRKWVKDIENLAIPLKMLWENHRELLLATIHAFDIRNKNHITDHRFFVDAFFKNVMRAEKIADSTMDRLIALDAYKQRTKIKDQLILSLLLNALAFVVGVIYPIVGWTFFPRIILWFPLIVYFVLFFSLGCKIYWRREKGQKSY